MNGEIRIRLVELPVASTALTADPKMSYPDGAGLVLHFEYDEDGVRYRSGLSFGGVRAHRHHTESVCTVWHLKGAYDTLVEVQDSMWREELEALCAERGHRWGPLHHYMIYIDSSGCYEVVAQSWELLRPEKLR